VVAAGSLASARLPFNFSVAGEGLGAGLDERLGAAAPARAILKTAKELIFWKLASYLQKSLNGAALNCV
jgi:hypothetical protein